MAYPAAGLEPFFKYQALGNDFVVVDRRGSGIDFDAARSRALCDRHLGIGADGVLAILPSKNAVGRMVVHNADGSVAEMCGNGIRCVARWLAERDPARPARITIDTGAGLRECELTWEGATVSSVTVDMGIARFEPAARVVQGVEGRVVNLGNPHFVTLSTPAAEAGLVGPTVERDPAFPERTNVEFVSVRDPLTLDVMVWERGVGLTLACGTGACAAVAVTAIQLGLVPGDSWVRVNLPGGALSVRIAIDDNRVSMRGAATFVFSGKLPA